MGLNWIPANLILFFLLSLIGYAIFDRRWKLLWVNLGITMPEGSKVLIAAAAGLLFSPLVLIPFLRLADVSGNLVMEYEAFAGVSLTPLTLLTAFAWAFLHQGFPEELFFRGFLLGQLTRRMRFASANTIQALVFWLLHVPGFIHLWSITGAGFIVVLAPVTLAMSLLLGWLRVRDRNRSLAAPVMLHTLANGVAYSMIMLLS